MEEIVSESQLKQYQPLIQETKELISSLKDEDIKQALKDKLSIQLFSECCFSLLILVVDQPLKTVFDIKVELSSTLMPKDDGAYLKILKLSKLKELLLEFLDLITQLRINKINFDNAYTKYPNLFNRSIFEDRIRSPMLPELVKKFYRINFNLFQNYYALRKITLYNLELV